MKKILFLLLCGLAAFFSSCKDDGKDGPAFSFSRPAATDITETTANVSCRAGFDASQFPGIKTGFIYSRADDLTNQCWEVNDVTVDGHTISARLTGLEPGARYSVYAVASLGASSFESVSAEFETRSVSGDGPVLEIVSETTIAAAAEAADYTIRYEVIHPADGALAAAACEADWIGSIDNTVLGTITFRTVANTGAARQGTVTVSYPGAEPREVTVNQAGTTPSPAEPAFGTPSHSSVTASGATVSCSFTYDGDGTISNVWFAYKASSGAEQRAEVTASAGSKSASLTGLTASTAYTYRLCAEIGGKTYSSAEGRFTTASGGGVDPKPGNTKYSGWAELVPEDKSNSDYYYAYHFCPDFKIGSYQARNYTVCFSAEHHCPVWVAAPRHACYEGSANRTNAYGKDPDIPSNLQYNSKAIGGGCNKGHMLGSAERTRSTAINKQVFYYTNIAPQYSSGFNTGGGGWNTLEDWIDKQVCADTTYLVIGTYFEPYTDHYGNSASPKKISFGGRSDVSCPTMFYIAALRTKKGNSRKWVVDCTADELKCAVFVRCHNNKLKGVKVSSKDMISVAELERLTGHTFFSNVPNAPKDSYNPSDWGL